MTAPGTPRFIAKKLDRTWGVYDTLTGSWPAVRMPPVGVVKQAMKTEEEAQAEADRLTELEG